MSPDESKSQSKFQSGVCRERRFAKGRILPKKYRDVDEISFVDGRKTEAPPPADVWNASGEESTAADEKTGGIRSGGLFAGFRGKTLASGCERISILLMLFHSIGKMSLSNRP